MDATATSAQPSQPGRRASMGAARAVVLMARPSQLALIALLFLNGILLAAWRGAAAELVAMVPALVLLLVAAMALHLTNEAADVDTDRLSTRTPFSGGSGALEASGLSPRVPMALGLTFAVTVVAGAAVALATAALSGIAFALLLLGLVGGLAYSLPPVAAMRRGWGEPLNAILGGLMLPLYGVAVVALTPAWLDVVAFLPFTAVVLASVLATAWPDRVADEATGKRTMQVRLAPPTLRLITLLASVVFIVATVASVISGAMPFAAAGLLVVPLLGLGLYRYTRVDDPIANVAAMVGLGVITFVGLAVAVATSGDTT